MNTRSYYYLAMPFKATNGIPVSMPAPANCPNVETLSQLLLGALPVNEQTLLEQHLDTCVDCLTSAVNVLQEDELTEIIRCAALGSDHSYDFLPGERAAMENAIARIKKTQREQSTIPILETVGVNRVHDVRSDGTPDISSDNHPPLFLQPAEGPNEIGRIGKYRVLELLGAGGMGVVFRAEDTRLRRPVAIKTMKPSIAFHRDAKARFLREARAAAALDHENIISIYEVDEQNEIPFFAMQYLRGESLSNLIHRDQRLLQQDVLKIAHGIASGLTAAHAHGLIHRDIKPDNIWLEQRTGRPILLDFGLVGGAADDKGLTQTGMVLGTPRYMSPEQANGFPLDQRSDLFSLGSVLYLMATGAPPFVGDGYTATLFAVAHKPPVPVQNLAPDLNPTLAALIMQLLEKDPASRPQSASDLAIRLADIEQSSDLLSPQASHEIALSRTKPKTNWPIALAVLITLGLVFGAGIFLITIKDRDGKETQFRVPAESSADIRIEPGSTLSIVEQPNSTFVEPRPVITLWTGWPDDAPPPATAPFDAAQAKQHQVAWATYLNVPTEFTNSIGMQFKLIPPGQFMMGSTAKEVDEALRMALKIAPRNTYWQEHIKSEWPKHKTLLTKAFYLGVKEVTRAEYEVIMEIDLLKSKVPSTDKEANLALDANRYAASKVSWYDAVEFCAKLNSTEKLGAFSYTNSETLGTGDEACYRLPTEAEWEYACRAGTITNFWIDEGELATAGWFASNSGNQANMAGELRANPFGLHDTHGNVWEWVLDSWEPTYYGTCAETSNVDPAGPSQPGSTRVLRGGGWSSHESGCRTASRHALEPTARYANIGVRLSLPIKSVRSKAE